MRVSYVHPGLADHVWKEILPMVERGVRKGQGDHTTPERLLEGIKSGDLVLLIVVDDKIRAGCIVDILQHHTKKVLFVVMLAGEGMNDWIDALISSLVQYKDAVGADAIEASCRDGLVRYLGKRGWSKKAVIMEY